MLFVPSGSELAAALLEHAQLLDYAATIAKRPSPCLNYGAGSSPVSGRHPARRHNWDIFMLRAVADVTIDAIGNVAESPRLIKAEVGNAALSSLFCQ